MYQVELEMQNEELCWAQAELEAERRRYFDLYQLAPVGYCTLSGKGLFVEANRAVAALLGVNRDVLVRQPFTRFICKEDLNLYNVCRKQLLETGEPHTCELRMMKMDGTPFWVRLDSAAAQSAEGAPVCLVALSDITGRKRGEEALRQSEERNRTTLRTAMDGFWRVDLQGRLLEANEAYCRMSGYTERELLAMSIPDLEAIETPSDTAARIRSLVARGEGRFESRHRRKDGSTFAVESSVQYRPSEGGGYMVAFLRDITGRKQAEEALLKLSAQLNRAEENERRRIARELHDSVGQNLAALGMNVGLLHDRTRVKDRQTDKMFEACLAMITHCVQEVRTVSYLLHPPLLDEFGLAAVIGDYAVGFSKRSGVRVALDMPSDLERLPPEVELALFRLVQESLGNIHRHARATAARIRLRCDAEHVVVEVCDNGRGMPAKKLSAIRTGIGSEGVGIAGMCERLRLVGGQLEIESCKKGTTVRACILRREEAT